ncbi:hypothetical protein [Paraburkholderia tropica]|uniref:hypothetical protein n=1 Tax=Paraburkholderia tropica TaxID=92647 RepID=UPI002AB6DB3C|nr:hypothetical protein [Paraburkholderia tropica]
MEQFFQVAIVISLVVLLVMIFQYRATGNTTFMKLSVLTVMLTVAGFLLIQHTNG